MSLSDEYLMEKVKIGDAQKLGLLFERYHVELYNFFLKFSNDRDLSLDLTQNVFYRILKYKSSYKGREKFRTWMYKIARNVRFDEFNKTKISRNSAEIEGLLDAFQTPDASEHLEKKESLALLKEAINLLDEEKRELLVMSVFGEMPISQMAEIYEISENNIRVRIHRALNELRNVFNKIC